VRRDAHPACGRRRSGIAMLRREQTGERFWHLIDEEHWLMRSRGGGGDGPAFACPVHRTQLRFA
jgi:hypothetical protein